MAAPRKWSHEDDATIRLIAAGTMIKEVAERLGVNRESICRRMAHLGVTKDGFVPTRFDPMMITNREPLPPGHHLTWGAMTSGTVLEGTPYPDHGR